MAPRPAEKQGLAHPRPERVLALAADAFAATAAEKLHLESCSQCRDEIAWARDTRRVPGVSLDVFDLRGQRVRSLVDGAVPGGWRWRRGTAATLRAARCPPASFSCGSRPKAGS